MSLRIPRSILEHGQALYIKEKLSISPVEIPWKKRKYANSSDAILSYRMQDVDGVTMLQLPFSFGMKFTCSNNDHLPHQRTNFQFTGKMRDEQRPYINQTMEYLNNHRSTVLNMRPGFGKTTMSVYLSTLSGLLTLVLIHDTGLISQWVKAYKLRSNAIVWSVGVDKVPPPGFQVIVCLYTRTTKIDPAIRDKVGFLIVDEIHQFNNKTGIWSILDFSPKYVLAATATFEKANGMHLVTESVIGSMRVSAPLDVEFDVVRVNTGHVATRVAGPSGDTDWTKLKQSLLYNDERNQLVVRCVHMLAAKGRKSIVFTTEVDHVKELHRCIVDSGLQSTDYITGSKSSYTDSAILIGNTQKCGTGFDEEMYCENFGGERINAVVIAGSFKDQALLYQVVGRAFRSVRPIIFHLVDEDSTIKRHWSSCKSWYTANGGCVTTISNNQIPPITTKPTLTLV